MRGEIQLKHGNTSYCFSLATGELRENAIDLHRLRYQQIGFMPEGFQDPYEKDSIYFVAQHTESYQVVGVCRLILQNLRTLPTYINFELSNDARSALHQLKPSTYAELGAVAALPHHRGLVPGLLTTALTHALALGMTYVLCCSDQKFFRVMQKSLGIPYQVIGREKFFYGSTKIPCLVSVPETLERLRARKPQAFQHL